MWLLFFNQVKQELERVKSAMVQVKSIQDKDKRQRVNIPAAERFISSAIWNPGESKKRKSGPDDSGVQSKKAKWHLPPFNFNFVMCCFDKFGIGDSLLLKQILSIKISADIEFGRLIFVVVASGYHQLEKLINLSSIDAVLCQQEFEVSGEIALIVILLLALGIRNYKYLVPFSNAMS